MRKLGDWQIYLWNDESREAKWILSVVRIVFCQLSVFLLGLAYWTAKAGAVDGVVSELQLISGKSSKNSSSWGDYSQFTGLY